MRNLSVGLIKGQNETPNSVESYIFEEDIEDIFDSESIRSHITKFILNEVGIDFKIDGGAYAYSGKKSLNVYITGFAPVVYELVDLCNKYGVFLTLLHYDSSTGAYYPQFLGDDETIQHFI